MPMGGSGSTNSTVTQTNLPEYARPYFESLMDRAEKESKTDYIPYKGDRIADMSAQTKAGLNLATQYGNSGTGYLDKSGRTLTNVANQAMAMNYKPSTYQAQQMSFGQGGIDRLGFGQGGIDKVSTDQFGSQYLNQYMSPYMDAVVNKAQQDAIENAAQEQATRNLQAARAGSFGGSRAAVQNQIANNALQSNLTDIMVKGQQSAFENAQAQFNQDRGRMLEAAMANQQTGLSMGQSNQQAGLTMGQSNQQAALEAARLREQSRQYGSDMKLRGLDLSRQAGTDLMNLQGVRDDAYLSRIKSLLGVGTTKEDYQQQELDQRYNDFVNQRDAERMNLQFLSSILQGVPISVNSDVTQSSQGNNLQGMIGTMGGLQALMGLGNK